MLTDTGSILEAALDRGGAAGAFNVIQLEHAEGLVAGAEQAGTPLILQVSQNTVGFHGSLGPLGSAMLKIAEEASVPVAVHLDHATDRRLVEEAVALGFGSVMFDGSALAYDDNVSATADVREWCQGRGVWVEAELGEVGGKDGVHDPQARTDPGEAAAFVEATGVDALAVAVGNSHAMTEQTSRLDHDLIARLGAAVPVPLVLHGSSGASDDELAQAVRSGITKVNIATRFNKLMTDQIRQVLDSQPTVTDPRRYMAPARSAIAAEAARLLLLLA